MSENPTTRAVLIILMCASFMMAGCTFIWGIVVTWSSIAAILFPFPEVQARLLMLLGPIYYYCLVWWVFSHACYRVNWLNIIGDAKDKYFIAFFAVFPALCIPALGFAIYHLGKWILFGT